MKDWQRRTGKIILIGVGATLAALIIIISAVVLYILIKQPFGIKLFSKDETPNTATYDHPLLNTEQEKVLNSLGVDPATLPETLTQEQITCFEAKLG